LITNCKQIKKRKEGRKEQNQTKRNQKTNIKLARPNRLIISNGEKGERQKREEAATQNKKI